MGGKDTQGSKYFPTRYLLVTKGQVVTLQGRTQQTPPPAGTKENITDNGARCHHVPPEGMYPEGTALVL